MSNRTFKYMMDTTNNRKVYSIARKHCLESERKISCSICPYHEKENASKKQKSWKKVRKNKWKIAVIGIGVVR